MNTNFPSQSELLSICALGMLEHKAKIAAQQIRVPQMDEPCALAISPLLRQPHVTYADFMAGRDQQKEA